MQNIRYLDYNFKSKSVKECFNNDYFIVAYSLLNDELLELFENIEDIPKFFNVPLSKILYVIKNNLCIEYNHHKYKLYVFEKEKEIKIESRGKKI